ncbi:MAG: tRNA (adenosine(37)-N6)-threonylcarbamoyltransferase complex dimerization subunit type 1 TsaB [Planctomycetes bacterium]|nr:tRNA (adenosine(37)-N6)-threonylcarbamoyltransferase complex dimerization subunit type 1 TsaB [Planctomycetota bacterium]MBI3843092.1 tRNA (adenosine(37)-N6)-threonylcarbamoyltransferase complex dimerization subunit type 1 TsaB [Planctomycetota bacterium]
MSGPIHVAIETSGSTGSLAVSRDGAFLAEVSFPEGAVHAREILPNLKELARVHGFAARDVALVVADVGPGSLTGIRVGLATAKAFAFATSCAIVGIVSCDALARRIRPAPSRLACAIDARRGEVFVATYEATGDGTLGRRGEVEACAPEALAARLPQGTLVVGNALERFGELFRAAGLVLGTPELSIPRASDLLRLGEDAFAAGRAGDLHTIQPLYLRPSV